MPVKFNAARRVKYIMEFATGPSRDWRTLDVWSQLLGTGELPDSQFETVRLLGLLNRQIEEVRAEVERLGLDESDYSITFENLSNVVRIGNFDVPWQEYRQYITDELLRQLGIFSRLSPTDETEVPSEDFKQLKTDLLAFREEVLKNVEDDRLKAFVLQQIETILRAIREYPIRGEEAIKDGDKIVVAAALSEGELLQEHKGEEVVEKTATFWERLRKLAPKVVINLDPTRMLTNVDPQKVLEAGSDVMDKLP